MKYNLNINQVQAIELGITNINQAHIFDLLTSASTWADAEIVNDTVYYWVARQTIAKELELLNLKPDTIYRHLKSLNEIKLIDYIKVGKKDCIKITLKGKRYISKDNKNTISETNPKHYVGNKSELKQNSEINPTKLGNKSENHSDLNPTYHNTNTNHNTNDNKYIHKEKNKKEFSFTLSKKTSLENTSQEYQETLKNYITKSGKSMSYEDFYNTCVMKGYQYKNYKLAYDKWNNSQNSNTNSPQLQNNTSTNQTTVKHVLSEYVIDRQNGMTQDVATLLAKEKLNWGFHKELQKVISDTEYNWYKQQSAQQQLNSEDEHQKQVQAMVDNL